MCYSHGASQGAVGGEKVKTGQRGVNRSPKNIGKEAGVTERRPDGPGEAKQKPAEGGMAGKGLHLAMTGEPRGFSRVTAGFSSYDG